MIRIKVEIVEQLHASNATDNDGSTALMYACEKGYILISLKYSLKKVQISLQMPIQLSMMTPLHLRKTLTRRRNATDTFIKYKIDG